MSKTLAFAVGLFIAAVGVCGIVAPSSGVWLARAFVAFGAVGFYAIALVRIAVGFLLISAAPVSRAPSALRILGFVVVILGIAAGIAGLLAAGSADAAIEWWQRQETGVLRLTALVILGLGAFVAYACAPTGEAKDIA